MLRTCGITGHRAIDVSKIDDVKRELRREISEAIADGYTRFLSGMAEGVDLYFSEIVAELEEDNPTLTLEAVLAHPGRLDSKDQDFHRLLKVCNSTVIRSPKYTPNCYLIRNRYIVIESSRVIAVYDGREKGGTVSTMRYASTLQRDLRVIRVDEL